MVLAASRLNIECFEVEREQTREVHEEAQIEEQVEASVSATDTAFDLGNKDTGPEQLKLPQYSQDQFGMQKLAFQPK